MLLTNMELDHACHSLDRVYGVCHFERPGTCGAPALSIEPVRATSAPHAAKPAPVPAPPPGEIVISPNELPGQPPLVSASGIILSQPRALPSGKTVGQCLLVLPSSARLRLPAPRGPRVQTSQQ